MWGLVLFIVSNILACFLLPLGITYGVASQFWHHSLKTGIKGANKKFMVLATAMDKYGNVACAELLNRFLIKSYSRHKFGDIRQTISIVLGLNILDNTVTRLGDTLDDILNLLDDGHSIRAATDWLEKEHT